MIRLFLLEPEAPGAAWAPFAGVRPLAELRAGMWRIRERWEAAFDTDTTAVFGAHVEGFSEGDEAPVRSPAPVEGPAVVGASWFAPSGVTVDPASGVRRLVHGGATVGWIVGEGERWSGPHERGPALEIDGLPLRGAFDLVTALERFLGADCADLEAAPRDGIPDGSVVLGDPRRVVLRGASVEPGVVFDVRQGTVVLEAEAEVRHGSRLEGPLYVGPGTRVLGGFLRGCSLGPECRVHGEVVASVFLGYANKSHD
ncbi:MAG TPA: putative sugar nucleotidyl transferase, partial [Gemmatimonadales bacterium]|nr:putative sugar nucleotidyl transferase [Gemmatimonadales bacterium]